MVAVNKPLGSNRQIHPPDKIRIMKTLLAPRPVALGCCLVPINTNFKINLMAAEKIPSKLHPARWHWFGLKYNGLTLPAVWLIISLSLWASIKGSPPEKINSAGATGRI
jgi:hypothetical protein